MTFQSPRGTTDILPQDQQFWALIRTATQNIAERFGYSRIETPIFEDTGLFNRGVGQSTDIIEKETYTFIDRGGDSLTLRPEGTAPICRSYVEHGMHNLPQPIRLFYLIQNFRYERPQAGRFRQHNQFGIEVFGEPDAYIDAEVIEVAWRFLEELNLHNISLSINSIGDALCRPNYVTNLKKYYSDLRNTLCEDCDRRLDTNPLRLLDCKVEGCQPIVANAPKSEDHLCRECEEHWNELQTHLVNIKIPFFIDHRLVRGLDYYSRTVFEISPPVDGRTNVIAGGGRYDGLIEQIGGPNTPGIGFGMGLERVIDNLKRENIAPPQINSTLILIAHMGNPAKTEAIRLASQIRSTGCRTVIGPSRGLKSQLRYANSIKASHCIIIGDDELKDGTYTVRNLNDSDQNRLSPKAIMEKFSKSV
jgi:histidyl-tRNA synthetase